MTKKNRTDRLQSQDTLPQRLPLRDLAIQPPLARPDRHLVLSLRSHLLQHFHQPDRLRIDRLEVLPGVRGSAARHGSCYLLLLPGNPRAHVGADGGAFRWR
jgi:hypothetical protein